MQRLMGCLQIVTLHPAQDDDDCIVVFPRFIILTLTVQLLYPWTVLAVIIAPDNDDGILIFAVYSVAEEVLLVFDMYLQGRCIWGKEDLRRPQE